MNPIPRTCITAALAAALAVPAVADARDKAAGWARWVERAERISTEIEYARSAGLDTACKGVTGTVIGQGFQFPSWGQALIEVCTVTQAALHGSQNNRRSRQICNDLQRVSRKIGKAEPVPEAPRAQQVALDIASMMLQLRDQLCVNFR